MPKLSSAVFAAAPARRKKSLSKTPGTPRWSLGWRSWARTATLLRFRCRSCRLVLEPGSDEAIDVRFAPRRRQVGALRATLRIVSNDPDARRRVVGLYGLSARGQQGGGEPSLQAIVRTLGYTVNVGRRSLILGTSPRPIGNEVRVSLFEKAGSGPVTMTPVARYSPDDSLRVWGLHRRRWARP